jgi:hypothetical protein
MMHGRTGDEVTLHARCFSYKLPAIILDIFLIYIFAGQTPSSCGIVRTENIMFIFSPV